MYYLSFDIANKSLATSYIYYNNDSYTNLKNNNKTINTNSNFKSNNTNAILLLEKLNNINQTINNNIKYSLILC